VCPLHSGRQSLRCVKRTGDHDEIAKPAVALAVCSLLSCVGAPDQGGRTGERAADDPMLLQPQARVPLANNVVLGSRSLC